MKIITTAFAALLLTACATPAPQSTGPDTTILTVIGTNDVHGEILPAENSGGLAAFSGYVQAVREARANDGGAVLLIDAGDMWQGTLESNLVEGESVLAAYNAMQYTAVTIGNHEFDFGPVGPSSVPEKEGDDPRGALKQRIAEANFPVLSANIVYAASGKNIDWENVTPSTMVEAAGAKIGIIGLTTAYTLAVTATANTVGLEITPLAEAIVREASVLRDDGADIVIVTAHAGGYCEEWDDPYDISSCNPDNEIVKVANALPEGLVDYIVAGHMHAPMAHVINGIAVTSAFSNTLGFDRVDFILNAATGAVIERKVFPPQMNCPAYKRASSECEWTETDPAIVEPATYEGAVIRPIPEVVAIADQARRHTDAIKSESLGVFLETPFIRDDTAESPIARLFTDAILEGVDADISIHNVAGGIRADLQAGPITFGDVYEISPFDNRVVVLTVSGEELRRVISAQAMKSGRRAGFSGMRAFVGCENGEPDINMVLSNGREIDNEDQIRVSTNDFLATLGDGIFTPAMPEGGFEYEEDPRFNRDLIVEWLKKRGGTLTAREFGGEDNRRWNFSDSFVAQCQDGV